MTKARAVLSVALIALCAAPGADAAGTRPVYPPQRVAWIVAQGYAGSSGYPWPGPPWSWPLPAPRYGCYVFRQQRSGAWRDIEVCE